MDTIPKGQPISVQAMREQIAQRHHSDVACPLSTSSSARVVAEAAWEEIQAGIATDRVTPFWRAIEPDSALAQKLTCGATFLQTMRESEAV